jgi:ribosome biogenesis GTPase
MTDQYDLTRLGWSAHFQRLISAADVNNTQLARVSGVHRDQLAALATDGDIALRTASGQTTGDYAVGDWVRFDPTTRRVIEILERKTLLQRRAAGTGADAQLIAANVDTLFVVTSCNDDFNVPRLERYLALASAAGCLPVFVLTKADMTDDPQSFQRQAERLSPLATAINLDARDPLEIKVLEPWCRNGETVALVGSSGVGKSTITNGLTGSAIATQNIREDDAKGRHTTTSRHLLPTDAGGWIIDTPGMRALRLTGSSEGVDAVFSDVAELAKQCRFGDCQHMAEPGCAVQAAISNGALDSDRLARWQKLQNEDARNSRTLAEARAHDRELSKMYREGQSRGRNKRGN